MKYSSNYASGSIPKKDPGNEAVSTITESERTTEMKQWYLVCLYTVLLFWPPCTAILFAPVLLVVLNSRS